MRERVQKLLAREGHGSRREIERWVRAGRLAINGQVANLGALVGPADRIELDGRSLRTHRRVSGPERCIMYHRPAGESLEPDADPPSKLFTDLPKRAGRRWIFLNPMHPSDSGLELLTTDGALASALMRRATTLGGRFAVRVRGEATETQLAQIAAGELDDGTSLGTTTVEAGGGEAANRWYEISVRGPRATAVRRLFTLAGLEVNRIIRVAYGPVVLDSKLSRGRHRELEPAELESLYTAAELKSPAATTAAPKGPASKGPASRGPARRAPVRRKRIARRD
ncbi:MAG TPA: S4 domain-containing protein [Steroidobacteraceae bacterium]|nr:S4 domain-containing protein [Steroidobacteraceae bacterium]